MVPGRPHATGNNDVDDDDDHCDVDPPRSPPCSTNPYSFYYFWLFPVMTVPARPHTSPQGTL